MKAYLYCDKRSLNDATIYYVDIIKEALKDRNYELITVHRLSDIKNANLILTITAKYFLQAKFRFPLTKTIFWAQGISEEAEWNGQSKPICIFKEFAERVAVRHSSVLMVVSKAMQSHFANKYDYNPANCFIMPCFNKHLNESWNNNQYNNPAFVYAGSASVWQAVDQMLDVYKEVEQKIQNASLTILSNQQKEFESKIQERGIHNYTIKYVPLEKLEDELSNYKYGLLLREDHIVNKVATPTKMNSYLSAHLIPIFSSAVDDFNENIRLAEFTLKASTPIDSDRVANQIISFESSNHDYGQYRKLLIELFNKHYNRKAYVSTLVKLLENSKI